jgi:predicted nucleotidyltransferase
MDRAEATEKMTAILERVAVQEPPLDLVEAIYVFGSYARGALEVRDVDLDLEIVADDPRVGLMLDTDAGLEPLLAAVTAGDEAVEFALNRATRFAAEGFDLVKLWGRGQSAAEAVARLEAIPADPAAAAGVPEHMLPALEGLEHLTTRSERALLVDLAAHQAINLSRTRARELPAPLFGADVPLLAVVRALRDSPTAAWRFGEEALVLERAGRFAIELDGALERANLVWHDLLWEDELAEEQN